MTDNPVIEVATVAPRMPVAPRHALPAGACDTHNHVFGPFDRFPLGTQPAWRMPLAPSALHARMLGDVGLSRAVLVQPSQYATDVAALTDALARAPGALRGIGAARSDVSDAVLDDMQALGIRGLRFVEAFNPDGSVRPGAVDSRQMRALAPRLAARGLHAQIWAGSTDLHAVLADVASLGIPLVVDHMGMVDTGAGLEDPRFQRLLGLVRDGLIWVKLAVCRVGKASGYTDVRPFHDALVDANSDQLLWASDWPFIRLEENAPDVGALSDLLHDWLGDDTLWRKILVDNPARLFGFGPAEAEHVDECGVTP